MKPQVSSGGGNKMHMHDGRAQIEKIPVNTDNQLDFCARVSDKCCEPEQSTTYDPRAISWR